MRAFTLLEAMVTLVIMAIVATAAVSAFAAFSRLARQTEREAVLTETTAVAVRYLTTEARSAGGVGVLPFSAAIVEDDCAGRDGFPDCQGSDRLTLVQGIPTYPGCRVIDDLGGDKLRFEAVDFSCCFSEAAPFLRQLALIKGDAMQPVVLKGVGGCVFEKHDIVPERALPIAAPADWRDAVAVLVDVKTFYVDWTKPGEGSLTLHAELNGDGDVSGERLTILERVADFQAAIGYDTGADLVLESSSGLDDGWWPSVQDSERGRPENGGLAAKKARFLGFSAIGIDDGGPEVSQVQTPWGRLRTLSRRLSVVVTERIALPQE